MVNWRHHLVFKRRMSLYSVSLSLKPEKNKMHTNFGRMSTFQSSTESFLPQCVLFKNLSDGNDTSFFLYMTWDNFFLKNTKREEI